MTTENSGLSIGLCLDGGEDIKPCRKELGRVVNDLATAHVTDKMFEYDGKLMRVSLNCS